MGILGDIIVGAASGLWASIFCMVLPWTLCDLVVDIKKSLAKDDYLVVVFTLPNVLIAFLPFLLVYVVYDRLGIFFAVPFSVGLFWYQLLVILV